MDNVTYSIETQTKMTSSPGHCRQGTRMEVEPYRSPGDYLKREGFGVRVLNDKETFDQQILSIDISSKNDSYLKVKEPEAFALTYLGQARI